MRGRKLESGWGKASIGNVAIRTREGTETLRIFFLNSGDDVAIRTREGTETGKISNIKVIVRVAIRTREGTETSWTICV